MPPSQVKADLQPYDSDDYSSNLGAPQDQVCLLLWLMISFCCYVTWCAR